VVYRRSLNITDLLFKGPDHFVYYKQKKGETWLPDEKKPLHKFEGLQVVGDITAVERNHRISVFGLDYCGRVFHLTWNGEHGYKDAAWEPVGSDDGFTGTVAATAWSDQRLYIAARRLKGNKISTRLITDGDNDFWYDLDGIAAAGSPSIVAASSKTVVVTTRDINHGQRAVVYKGETRPASAWQAFPNSILFADVAIAANADDDDSTVHTFHLGTQGAVWGFEWSGKEWRGGVGFGGELADAPAAVERIAGDDDDDDDNKRIDLYGLNRANKVVGLSFRRKTPGSHGGWKELPKQSEAVWASAPVPHPEKSRLYVRGTNGEVFEYTPGEQN
jgi:hypothetical protein